MQLGFSPQYVLDEMEDYEINAALQYQHYAFKDIWETSKLIAYFIAQTNSKNKIDYETFLPFAWENDNSSEEKTLTKEEIENYKKMAKSYIENNKNIEKRTL